MEFPANCCSTARPGCHNSWDFGDYAKVSVSIEIVIQVGEDARKAVAKSDSRRVVANWWLI